MSSGRRGGHLGRLQPLLSVFFTRERWLEVLDALRVNRLRTVLTAFGLFWGICTLILMVGFAQGIRDLTAREYGSSASNMILVRSITTTLPFQGHPPGRRIEFSRTDAELLEAIPGVLAVDYRLESRSMVAAGGYSRSMSVVGQSPSTASREVDGLVEGRLLNERDALERRKLAVIGWDVRTLFFPEHTTAVGALLRMGSSSVRVVGVTRNPGNDAAARRANSRIVMASSTLSVLMPALRPSTLAVFVRDDATPHTIIGSIRDLLLERHRIAGDDGGGLSITNATTHYGQVRGLTRAMSMFAWVVGAMTMLAGALGVSNIMLVSIAQRAREFAIRKAIGASPLELGAQVTLETLTLCGISGYAGLVVGVGTLELVRVASQRIPALVQRNMVIEPHVDVSTAALASVTLVLVGMLAALAPTRRVLRLRPVEFLGSE